MWIVKLALRRPYTFVVMALLILLLGVASIKNTPTDVFPEIDIPVVTVVWQYSGLSADQMAKQITTFSEYTISSAVDNVKNIESQTLAGVAVIRIFFQPNVRIDSAIAQVTAVSQTILRRMPPGTQPPFIIRYNASSVPILQLALGSESLSEAQLYDYGIYRVRQAIAPVRGATLPLPYGGKPRQIMVDLDPQALLAKGLSPLDVGNAVYAQNLTLPTGTSKIGEREFTVSLNSSPDTVAALNDVPIKQVNGSMVYVRDVAHVRDGFAVQTNVVRKDGSHSALLTILKNGGASTLDIVNQIKALLPGMRAAAPPGLEITELFDQSIFVRAAISGVVKEGVIAALLTATMILLFLGSWRSFLAELLGLVEGLAAQFLTLGNGFGSDRFGLFFRLLFEFSGFRFYLADQAGGIGVIGGSSREDERGKEDTGAKERSHSRKKPTEKDHSAPPERRMHPESCALADTALLSLLMFPASLMAFSIVVVHGIPMPNQPNTNEDLSAQGVG